MDPILLTVLLKGGGMIFALFIGFITVRYGYRLYKDGAGHGSDKAAFEVGNIKLSAHSVGSVVMSTAFLWGLIGVWLSPNVDQTGDGIRVYSFKEQDNEVLATALRANATRKDRQDVLKDPEMLKTYLELAYSKTKNSEPLFSVNDSPGKLDLATIKVDEARPGEFVIGAVVETSEDNVDVTFKPVLENKEILFLPSKASLRDQ